MRLTVLGGSAAGANPGQGCSGYLVDSGPTRLVLDLGPATFPELRRHVDFREVDAVILSHLHLDHTLDVLTLRYALAYNPIAPSRPVPLWLPPGGLAFFGRLASALESSTGAGDFFAVFTAREYDPGLPLQIGDLEIKFQPTVHYVPCWAMRVSNGVDGDLSYTADTGPAADLARFAFGSQVLIAEGAERESPQEPRASRGHLTPSEAGALAREAAVSVLLLSHLWAERDLFAAVAKARASFGGTVELATPGLKITWRSTDV